MARHRQSHFHWVPLVSVPNKTVEGVWLNVFFLLSWCNIKGSCFLISQPGLYCWVMTSQKFERWARECSPPNPPACLLLRQNGHIVFTHIITWPALSTISRYAFTFASEEKCHQHSTSPTSLLNQTVAHCAGCVSDPLPIKSPQGLTLSFNCEHRTPAL